jgi:hypothetical protein
MTAEAVLFEEGLGGTVAGDVRCNGRGILGRAKSSDGPKQREHQRDFSQEAVAVVVAECGGVVGIEPDHARNPVGRFESN